MKRLHKSRNDRVLAGVCGGIAEFFGIDPTLVRLAWAVMIFFGGSGLLLYIICALIIPNDTGDNYYGPSQNQGMDMDGTDENGKRIRKSVYGKTKLEVTMKMLAVKADNPTIGCSAIKNETFRTLMQEWLMTFKRPSVSPRTFERCLSTARNTLYPMFGEMKIDEITAPMLQRLFNKMI